MIFGKNPNSTGWEAIAAPSGNGMAKETAAAGGPTSGTISMFFPTY